MKRVFKRIWYILIFVVLCGMFDQAINLDFAPSIREGLIVTWKTLGWIFWGFCVLALPYGCLQFIADKKRPLETKISGTLYAVVLLICFITLLKGTVAVLTAGSVISVVMEKLESVEKEIAQMQEEI